MGTSKSSRRTWSRCRRSRSRQMCCGCTCFTMLCTPTQSKPGAHQRRSSIELPTRESSAASYIIVDHAAAIGAGTSDAQSLHRIDPSSVRREVEAAGFILDAESTVLANKNDSHAIKAFDPSTKGETDRFAYRFVKP